MSVLFVIEKWSTKRNAFVPTGNSRRTFKAAAELKTALDKKLPGETREIGKYVRAAESPGKRKK
jgi:hypothetical protein